MPVAAVTGATGAIGQAIAEGLARADHEVVLICRDERRAGLLADRIRRGTGNPEVRVELVDLALRSSVEELGRRWRGPVHTLINNAAIAPRSRQVTPEGIELQLATNVLGYLWLTQALEPVLRASAPARVVNVASYWAGGLDLDDLEFVERPYDNDRAYRQSKQADRMLTVALAERLGDHGVTVNACHPGDVPSTLANDLGFGGHESAVEGARTPLWLATTTVGAESNGLYFEHCRQVRCRFGEDREAVARLYQLCQQR